MKVEIVNVIKDGEIVKIKVVRRPKGAQRPATPLVVPDQDDPSVAKSE